MLEHIAKALGHQGKADYIPYSRRVYTVLCNSSERVPPKVSPPAHVSVVASIRWILNEMTGVYYVF